MQSPIADPPPADIAEPRLNGFEAYLQEAKERDFLEFIQNDGLPIPSLEQMEADIQKGNNLLEMNKRLETLAEEHERNLTRLLDKHAREYEQEALMRYRSMEEVIPPDVALDEETIRKYDDQFEMINKKRQERWEAEMKEEREAYQERVKFLEEQKRRIPGAPSGVSPSYIHIKFPRSEAELKALPHASQYRVAQYLSASTPLAKKQQIALEQGWGNETQELKDLCASNPMFESSLSAIMITPRDPRKRIF